MPGYASEVLDPKRQRLHEIIDKVSRHVQERKTRQILANETQKALSEINLFEPKMSTVARRLHETAQTLEDLEPRAIETKRKMAQLLQEKTAAATELAKLIKIESEIEAKLAAFSKLKSDVNDARADMHELTNVLNALKTSQLEAAQTKEANNKRAVELKDKIDKLLMELPAIISIRDMLAGIMPEGFDTDTIGQVNVEASIQSYTSEIETEIENVKRQTSDLKLQINKEKELESSLLSLQAELQKKIENLKTDVGERVNKQGIVAQTNKLRDQKEQLDKDFARNSQDLKRIEAESKAVIELLEPQQNVKKDLDQKLTKLAAIKQKMDATGDFEAEVHRLKTETNANIIEASVNKRLLETIAGIKNDLDSINKQLRSAVKSYGQQLEDFCNFMDGLLS